QKSVTTTMLDQAPRCASSPDEHICLQNGEMLYPVHSGAQTVNSEHYTADAANPGVLTLTQCDQQCLPGDSLGYTLSVQPSAATSPGGTGIRTRTRSRTTRLTTAGTNTPATIPGKVPRVHAIAAPSQRTVTAATSQMASVPSGTATTCCPGLTDVHPLPTTGQT